VLLVTFWICASWANVSLSLCHSLIHARTFVLIFGGKQSASIDVTLAREVTMGTATAARCWPLHERNWTVTLSARGHRPGLANGSKAGPPWRPKSTRPARLAPPISQRSSSPVSSLPSFPTLNPHKDDRLDGYSALAQRRYTPRVLLDPALDVPFGRTVPPVWQQ
jgi:hypothetical protein